MKSVVVELVPEGGAFGSDAKRVRLRTRKTSTDADGSFTFDDVGEGSYLVIAEMDGFSSSSRAAVRVEAGQQLKVPALELRRPVSLEIVLMPPLDFDGKPWEIHLTRDLPAAAHHQIVARSPAGETGYWSAVDLDAGRYQIEVRNARGNRVDIRQADIEHDEMLAITIDRVPIDGAVDLAGEPMSARVALVSPDGARTEFRADSNGRFSGLLPREGTWRPVITLDSAVTINLDAIEIRRNSSGRAEVEISLPGGAIIGRVVDERGDPVAANVILFTGQRMEVSTRTSDAGTFRIRGLEEGPREIQAMNDAGESGRVSVRVTSDETEERTLTIRRPLRIRGRLIDTSGQSVPGAMIHYQNPRSEQRRTESGVDGEFSLVIPGDAPFVSLAVVAAGLPRTFATLTPGDSGSVTTIVVGRNRGRLTIVYPHPAPPWPVISGDHGQPFALFHLFVPAGSGVPREFDPSGSYVFDVEAGVYRVSRFAFGMPDGICPSLR